MAFTRADVELFRSSPQAFRDRLLIDSDVPEKRFVRLCDPWQREELAATDSAWEAAAGLGPKVEPRRFWNERPRSHSKSLDCAAQVAWAIAFSAKPIRVLLMGADKRQASPVLDAVAGLVAMNPWLAPLLDVQAQRVVNPRSGSVLQIVSSVSESSQGALPAALILDELAHWAPADQALWDVAISLSGKRRDCCLVTLSNAGFVPSWQHRARAIVEADSAWRFSAIGPRASWITPQELETQRRHLSDGEYRRLWLGEWVSPSAANGIGGSLIDAAVRLHRPPALEGGWAHVCGLDLGVARDNSSIVVIGKHVGGRRWVESPAEPRSRMNTILEDVGLIEPRSPAGQFVESPGTGRLRLCSVRTWTPAPGGQVNLIDVENELIAMFQRRMAACAFDPDECRFLAQRMTARGFNMVPVPPTAANLRELAGVTLETFRDGLIDLYDEPRLLADLRALEVDESGGGPRLRSRRTAEGHHDSATAFCLAVLAARRLNLRSAAVDPLPLTGALTPLELADMAEDFEHETRERGFGFGW